MKMLLTGATGFIGSHLLQALAATEWQVTALRRPGSRPCVPCPEPAWLEKPMDQLGPADMEGIDVLMHLASAGVSPKTASWQELFYWNVSVLLKLLETAKAAGVRRSVLAGSFAEYGLSADRYAFLPVDAPLLPTSPYAASKAAGCIAASAYAMEQGMELCYLRIFSVFGEGQFKGNFWPSLREAAMAGLDFPMSPGEQVRDYLPVEQAVAALLEHASAPGVEPGLPKIVNVGTGIPVSMRQFAETWWQRWGATGRLLPGALPYRRNECMRFVPEIGART